ncbi:MAG: MFS transporter [Pseudomonadales bacterium]|nr:MFS transporter [Pseudomonadales bacterium]MDP6470503.1 MFS transporter [Pseudomonadales bacterium]MDP6827805.1 MFS transporter [Pseudomonadales bacterium]MDP6972977.1 MFS transporter [Pseudomonadales bacterium]
MSEAIAIHSAVPPGEKLERQPIFWFYGCAAMAYGIKNNAFSYLLLMYANQVLGIPGYLASLALAVAMVWDAVSDLLLGHWSDKTSSRYGRRHPFMYVALFLLPLTFYALFNPVVSLEETSSFVYVLVMALLIRTGTTLFEVPSTALLPDLEQDYDRRNKWLALRHGFGWYGGNGIHTINFFFWVGAFGVTVQTGYSIYGVVGATVIFFTILASALGTQKAAAALPRPEDTFKVREIALEVQQIFQSLKNRNFAALFFYGLIVGVAQGLGMALYLYNTTYFFGFTGTMIAVTGIFVLLSPLIAYFIAPNVGSRFGKKKAAMIAILGNITLYPMPYILLLNGWWPEFGSWTSLILYSFFIVAEVVFVIIFGVLLDSMMADVVEDSEVSTYRRSEGLFFAARSFAQKAISAGGIIGAGAIVSLVGLDGVRSVEQVTYEIRFDLASLFLPLYCSLYLLGIYVISKYRIDREGHGNNLNKLATRA